MPHSAAKLPCIADALECAYLEDWQDHLRHRPAVPFGRSLELVSFMGVNAWLALTPSWSSTTAENLALEAARRARGELVSSRRADDGIVFLPGRSGRRFIPARASLAPEMAARCVTPRLLTYKNPPVIPQQQSLLQASPYHSIQGTANVMMTLAIVIGLLRAYWKASACTRRRHATTPFRMLLRSPTSRWVTISPPTRLWNTIPF